MILSSELNAQLERFSKTRSCSLASELKNELAMVLFDINGKRLNKSCGTCVRNAMQDVLNFISREVKFTQFVGIKQEAPIKTVDLDAMTYKELKAYAGVKGNIKREKIYELIDTLK